jgi:hypothetical protein
VRKHVRVCWGTNSVVDLVHVCNMAVVGFVRVLTVPTSLEVNLGTQTVDTQTRIGRQARCLWDAVCAQTSKTDGIRDRPIRIGCVSPSHARLIGRSQGLVTRQHLEAFGERNDVVGSLTTSQIIDDTSTVRNLLKRAVGMLIVKVWCPIGGVVRRDLTRSTF